MVTGKSKVSSKGWIVVPKEIRDEMELKPGDFVRFVLRDGSSRPRVELRKVPADPIAASAGMLKSDDGRLWTQEMVKEHRREVEDTERETRATRQRMKSRRRSA